MDLLGVIEYQPVQNLTGEQLSKLVKRKYSKFSQFQLLSVN
jgi:hypothetical protein